MDWLCVLWVADDVVATAAADEVGGVDGNDAPEWTRS